MRGATSLMLVIFAISSISIHAPHARSDAAYLGTLQRHRHFNPRSSCEERHHPFDYSICDFTYFNPRSSCEERLHRTASSCRYRDFNPRSSCEERLRHLFHIPVSNQISIHAPHARSDKWPQGINTPSTNFNPRSSCEERPLKTIAPSTP